MNSLPTSFRKGGFNHQQVSRAGDLAIFERSKEGQRPHFEVIKVQQYKAFKIGDKSYEAGEHYPGSEQWGSAGWTCHTLEEAQAKLRELEGANGH